jgi:hypothetical protein
LVSLKGSTDFVVRDITDIDHPFTVSTLGSQVDYASRFINAGEISTTADGSMGLVRMPLSGSPKTVVAACGANPSAWSPDGTAAAYMHRTADPKVQDLHVVSRGYDRVTDSTPALDFGVGCESRGCGDNWDVRLLYSPGGSYISLVQQLPVSVFRIWTAGGKVIKSADGSTATMSVWSGDSLYWRDDQGVQMWRNGAQSLVLPGVSWTGPHASSGGGKVVYMTRGVNYSTARIHVLDTASGKAREIALSRSYPSFLTSRYIWYRGERACVATDRCIEGPTIATGTTYIYDLETGVESESIITNVWDVWPRGA